MAQNVNILLEIDKNGEYMFQILSNTDLAWKLQSGEKRFKTICRNPLSREQETCQQCFESISIRMFYEDQGIDIESVFVKHESPLDIKEEIVVEEERPVPKTTPKTVVFLKPSPIEGFCKIVSVNRPEKRFLPIQNTVVKRNTKPRDEKETTVKELPSKNLKIVKVVSNDTASQKTLIQKTKVQNIVGISNSSDVKVFKIPDSLVTALKSPKVVKDSNSKLSDKSSDDVQILSTTEEIIDLETDDEKTTEGNQKIDEETIQKPKKKVITKETSRPIFIPNGVVLPDLSQFVPPFSFSENQSDGSTAFVKQEFRHGTVWITNFDLSNELKCEICGEMFSSITALVLHRRDTHFFQPNSIECSACHQIVQSNPEKMKHTLYCRRREEIVAGYCYICSKQFEDQMTLTHHITNNHKKVERKNSELLTKCYLCTKMVRARYHIYHIKYHRDEMRAAQQKIIEKEKLQANLSDIVKFQVVQEGVELPSNLLPNTRYSMKHLQSDGTFAYLETQGDNLWITNFDLACLHCDICDKAFSSITSLILHRREFHFFPAGSNECTACSGRFYGSFTLSHSLYCRNRKAIRVGYCYLCKEQFENQSALEKHLEEKVEIEKQTRGYVKCTICENSVCKYRLQQHMANHKRTNNEIYECAHCSKKFSSSAKILLHLGQLHFSSLCQYYCETCKPTKYFMKGNDWRRHMHRHYENKVICNHCGKSFTMTGLINHRQHLKLLEKKNQKGNEGPQATCNVCGKIFKMPSCLNSHMKSHLPKSERKHKCQYCEKRFNMLTSKIEHERDHTGEKPHICMYCEKAFAKRQTYRDHVRTHTGQGYKCEHCDKMLYDHSSFRKHLKIHEAQLGIKLTYTKEERRLKTIGLLEKMQGTTYL